MALGALWAWPRCQIREDKNKYCSDEQWRLQQIGLILCWSILSDQVLMVYQRRVAKSCSVSAKAEVGCSIDPWFPFWIARDTAGLVCCLWCFFPPGSWSWERMSFDILLFYDHQRARAWRSCLKLVPSAQQPTELWVGSHMQPSAAAPSSWIISVLYSFRCAFYDCKNPRRDRRSPVLSWSLNEWT